VVDHRVVETGALLDLAAGDLQALGDRARGVAAALLEALAQAQESRGQQEDEPRVRALLAHLTRALDFDLEQQIAAAPQRLFDRGPAGAVAIAVVHRPLEKRPVANQPVELAGRDEVIVDAVALCWAPRPRGMRDREFER